MPVMAGVTGGDDSVVLPRGRRPGEATPPELELVFKYSRLCP